MREVIFFFLVHNMEADLARRVRALQLLGKYTSCRRVAWDLEAAIYAAVLTSKIPQDYEAKVRQIAWNVFASPTLLTTYTVNALVHLDNATLAMGTEVERWHQQHDADMQRQHVLLHEEHKDNGGALVCNRCHSRNVEVSQKQTRSADEGMTVYCTCAKCGLRWRM